VSVVLQYFVQIMLASGKEMNMLDGEKIICCRTPCMSCRFTDGLVLICWLPCAGKFYLWDTVLNCYGVCNSDCSGLSSSKVLSLTGPFVQ
jgi:hypothetical protein